ncbi:MAG: sugar ABC transporter permease [Oscillospiraceae bacterium]|jgi:putative aldouronate transport system permease protein|nr:sugar ABC transporter permease [Oscillospiraceae bacterium]MBQ9290072.1 sugar ABC transporter permease [Clostridia bacterium]
MATLQETKKPRTLKEKLLHTGKRIALEKERYILILPGLVWYAIFAYIPIFGLTLAFRKYMAKLGMFGSPWIGLKNFQNVFADPAFFASIVTTLRINAGRLIFVFPFPILFAIMINEVRLGKPKKILQSIYTFPNFLSWVIVASIMINILGQRGLVNSVMGALFGTKPVAFLGKPDYFLPVIYLTDIWKTAGWSAIIYMASISGIDVEQYEAAEIDGASRLQRIWYITLPGIKSTILVLFILAVGNLMSGGFDQIFNLSNSATIKVAETLDMYIYRITFRGSVDFGFSSAVALFRSVINMLLLIFADRVSKAVGGSGLLG